MRTAQHDPSAAQRQRRIRWLQAVCALLWLGVTVAVVWFARALDRDIGGWPLGFWLAAQGVLLFYVVLVAVYAALMQKFEAPAAKASDSA
jgi:putative solute:sodium symporter small subunit